MEELKEPRHMVACEDCGYVYSGTKYANRLDAYDEAIRLNKKSVVCPECGAKIWVLNTSAMIGKTVHK